MSGHAAGGTTLIDGAIVIQNPVCLVFVGLSRDTINIFVPSLDFTPQSLLLSRL
jgi:hypothetical protein